MNLLALVFVAAIAAVPTVYVAAPSLHSPAPQEVPQEDCLTGETQCKATFEIVTNPVTGHGCGIEVRMKPGDQNDHGACKCDPSCVKDKTCKWKGEVQIRVTGTGHHVSAGGGCGPLNTWIAIGAMGSADGPLEADCGKSSGAIFFAGCYNGSCGAPTGLAAAIQVTPKCTSCTGNCPN